MNHVLAFVLCFLHAPSSYADEGAPFGLSWGMSTEQLEELGVQLSEIESDDSGKRFQAKNVPKIIHDIDYVVISQGFNDILHRVVAVSESFQDDPYGSNVKERYQTLSGLLAQKYGPGDINHYQDTEMWKDADEFLMGIKTGRSWHYTDFLKGHVWVQVGIRASRSNTGYYVLIFQNTELEKGVREQSLEREKDAL
jgi:hypothetical protein